MNHKFTSVRTSIRSFFLQPAPFLPFVFLRISFAVFSLCMCIALYPYIYDLYSNEGYMQWIITDHIFKKEFIPNIHDLLNLVNRFFAITDATLVRVSFQFFMFCLLCIGLGFFSNFFATFAWLIHLIFLNTANIYGYGVESFTHILLFYFIFMPVDAGFSVTRIIKKKRYANQKFVQRQHIMARIFLRLLQLHMCLIYLNAGLAKMLGTQWYNGEAVWRSFTQFKYNAFNLRWLAEFPWLLVLAGGLVLIMETLYPVFIWLPSTRKIFLSGIILMHVCIAVFMGLYFFGTIMIIMNLAAFGFKTSMPLGHIYSIVPGTSIKVR